MPLIVNTNHTKLPGIRDVYLRDKNSNNVPEHFKKRLDEMLVFIDAVDEMFPETKIWCLTSHMRLVLQTENDWKSNWYVIITTVGLGEYYFEYLMPKHKQPWSGAIVKGVVRTIEDAKKMLLISMRECEAWQGNEELEKRLSIFLTPHKFGQL